MIKIVRTGFRLVEIKIIVGIVRLCVLDNQSKQNQSNQIYYGKSE